MADLYGHAALAQHPDSPVLIAASEASAEALQLLAGDIYVCVTWNGLGCLNSDWSAVYGRQVLCVPSLATESQMMVLADHLSRHCTEVKRVSIKDYTAEYVLPTTWPDFAEWAIPRIVPIKVISTESAPPPTQVRQPAAIPPVDRAAGADTVQEGPEYPPYAPLDAYANDAAILDGMSKPDKRRKATSKPKIEPTDDVTAPRLVESADSFISRYTPVDYVVDGFLIRGYLYGLTSRPNHGKTTVATAIAVHVATGSPFAGMEVSGGRVLLLYGENSENSRLQLVAALQHFDVTGGNIDIVSRALPINQYIAQIQVETAARNQEYAMVLVDSSAAYFSYENENDNVQAGAHARDLRELTRLPGSPAVVICCHPTKAAERENLTPRGGGAFEAELDTSLILWNSDGVAEVSVGNKVRGPVIDQMSFKMEPITLDGFTDKKGRPLIVPAAKPMSDHQIAVAARATLEGDNRLLYAMLQEPKESMADWARSCGWIAKDGTPEKYKVQRALKRLVADKMVGKHRGTYLLTPLGEKEAKTIR